MREHAMIPYQEGLVLFLFWSIYYLNETEESLFLLSKMGGQFCFFPIFPLINGSVYPKKLKQHQKQNEK